MYHQDPIPSEKARFEYLHSFYSKINRGISRPSLLVHKLLNFLYGCNLLSDKLFLSLKFRLKMGGGINWKSPHTFNEKLQWLKLYNRRPEYTIMADKIEAKKWVAERIGEKYIIPTGSMDKSGRSGFRYSARQIRHQMQSQQRNGNVHLQRQTANGCAESP